MPTSTFVQPNTEIERDQYGRPLVLPTTGTGKRVAYTRATTFVDATEDRFNIERWQQRMVALGLARRADYLLAVATVAPDAETPPGKSKLNALCADAMKAAEADAKALIGTAMHKLAERYDLGLSMTDVPVPPDYVADLAAYVEATAPLKMVHVERSVVIDHMKIHGTPDRVVEYNGHRYIADLKTGSLDFGVGKIARQLAVYARGALYDDTTGERTPHGADTRRGLIIHLPVGTGTCRLVWVDLLAGWSGVQLCGVVREHRRHMTAATITVPGLENDGVPFVGIPTVDPMPVDNLMSAINGAQDRHDLDRIYSQNKSSFTDAHVAAAKIKVAEFAAAVTA